MVQTAQSPLYWEDTEEMARKTSLIVRELLEGKTNNTRVIKLTPGETQTSLTGERICCDTIPTLTPLSASAAAALASGMLWVESTARRITIHHDASEADDREFGVVLVG